MKNELVLEIYETLCVQIQAGKKAQKMLDELLLARPTFMKWKEKHEMVELLKERGSTEIFHDKLDNVNYNIHLVESEIQTCSDSKKLKVLKAKLRRWALKKAKLWEEKDLTK